MEFITANTLAIITSSFVALPVALFLLLSDVIAKTSANASVPPVIASK